MLLLGTSSGRISVQKATDTETDPFRYRTPLKGDSGEVECLYVRGSTLYSGSVEGNWLLPITIFNRQIQCVATSNSAYTMYFLEPRAMLEIPKKDFKSLRRDSLWYLLQIAYKGHAAKEEPKGHGVIVSNHVDDTQGDRGEDI